MPRIFVVFFLFAAVSANAQKPFWIQTTGPSGSNVADIAFNKHNDIFVSNGLLFRSTDHGSSWKRIGERLTGALQNIAISSNGSLFISDPGFRTFFSVYRSIDNGETWDTILKNTSSNITSDSTGILYAVGHTYPEDKFFRLRSTDNGNTWIDIQKFLPPDSNCAFSSFNIFQNDVLYLCGIGKYYTSTDKGTSWSPAFNLFPTGYNIQMKSTSNGFLFAYGNLNDSALFLRSVDRGTTWDTLPKDFFFEAISSNDVMGNMSYGYNTDTTYFTYSRDYGKNIDTLIIPYSYDLIERRERIKTDFEGNIYYITLQRIFKLDTKKNFTEDFSAPVSNVSTVFIGKNGTIWVSGWDRPFESKSSDHGNTWVTDGYTSWGNMAQDSADGIIRSISTVLMRSTNDGETWNKIRSSANDRIYSLIISPKGDIFIANLDSILMSSSDLGKTWEKHIEGLPNKTPQVITCDKKGTLYAAIDSTIFRSVDDGGHWEISTRLSSQVTCIAASLKEEVFVGTSKNGIFQSVDRGITWKPANENLPTDSISVIAAAPNGDIYALPKYGSEDVGIMYRPYQGLRWYLANSGLDDKRYLNTIALAPDGTAYLGTNGRGVWRSQGIVNAVNSSATSTDKITLSISPNPASSNATLTYSLPNREFVKLELCDELGRTLITFVKNIQDAGEHSFSAEFPNLANGIYFVRLVSAAGSAVEKIIIAK